MGIDEVFYIVLGNFSLLQPFDTFYFRINISFLRDIVALNVDNIVNVFSDYQRLYE